MFGLQLSVLVIYYSYRGIYLSWSLVSCSWNLYYELLLDLVCNVCLLLLVPRKDDRSHWNNQFLYYMKNSFEETNEAVLTLPDLLFIWNTYRDYYSVNSHVPSSNEFITTSYTGWTTTNCFDRYLRK